MAEHQPGSTESTRLFSDICREADPDFDKDDSVGYRFAGGRTIKSAGVYEDVEPEA